ncbi:hypothetical protein K144316041_p21110 (plasmid) [Clostridium tetani]|uniref:hypothetical protein n=1 Tax=Clostridium tetani TaxID=1513 RepID=UPI002952B56B|nr:hypothetical protein [Clostridium tetani]BDR74272.1 hypothetical protein K144316041_p21110 [Clostridium tetani]
MANEQNQLKQTLGRFSITGFITIDDKTFEENKPSKNNPNWIMNVFNPKVEGKSGKSMYMRFMDGFDKVKGKTIYARMKDTRDSIEIAFADRDKEALLEQLDDLSFIRIGLGKEKVKDEETGKEFERWNFRKFITIYDAIAFLKKTLEIGKTYKVRMKGGQKFSLFNGNINRNYDLQTIYILPENDTSECELGFKQNILLDSNSVDLTKWEDEGLMNIKAKVYQKKRKGEYEVLEIPFIIRAENEEIKKSYNKILELCLKIDDPDVIRRINFECYYNCGYVNGAVSEDDINPELQELIDEGVYNKDEVLSMNSTKERVDELLIRKPVIKNINGKVSVDKDDEEFKPEDLENLIVETEDEKIEVPNEKIDDDLLDELANL